jgi:hypothetical protein
MNFKSQNHNTNSFKNKFQSHSTKIKSICKLINREREETSYKVYIHKPKGKRESQYPTFKGIWYPELVQKKGTMGT